MENSSKALIMAGSVLIAILIIGVLVVSFRNLSEIKQEEMTAEQIQQIQEFNKSFESYNRENLYGNDIISIINKVEDYNKKESDEKGYVKIELKVNIKNAIVGTKHFEAKTYTYTQIREKYYELKDEIDEILKTKYNGRDISYYQGLTTEQLDEEINEMKSKKISINETEFKNDIDRYELLSTVLKEFKKKSFKCIGSEYEKNTGRINSLYFREN